MIKRIITAIFTLSSVLAASAQHEHHMENSANANSSGDSYSCPFLVKDSKGDILLSWVKTKGEESILCYATSKDKGGTFKDTIEVGPSRGLAPHGENLPKVISKSQGKVLAVWGIKNSNPKNKYSGLLLYSQSFDNGKTWSKAKSITSNAASFDQRYFDVELLHNGEAAIIWLDNPNDPDKEGSNLYFATTKGDAGFQGEKLIGETTCQCCRTDLLIDAKGNIHVAYRDILNDSIRDMVHAVSLDGGKTFTKTRRISEDNWKINGCPHTGPAMAVNKSGLHCVWFTRGGGTGVFYPNSKDMGNEFAGRTLLDSAARHPQMVSLDGGALGVVYEFGTVETGTGIQVRTIKKDRTFTLKTVSEGNGTCSFPVILAIDQQAALVSWVQEIPGEGEKKEQIINIKKIEVDGSDVPKASSHKH